MLNVILSVDVEIWCEGWENIQDKFNQCFARYIYGRTANGEFGLPFQLKTLREADLKCVCFVESLFSEVFGAEPLEEICQHIKDQRHEIQLHLHPEWSYELSNMRQFHQGRRKCFLKDLEASAQEELIALGKKNLKRASGIEPGAFRAGGFGANAATVSALKTQGFTMDSSYNERLTAGVSGWPESVVGADSIELNGIREYPLTVFRDGRERLRNVQLGACSSRELESLLWRAVEQQRSVFVILWHNFELLDRAQRKLDHIVLRRFLKLCEFLSRNRDVFNVCGFRDLDVDIPQRHFPHLAGSKWGKAVRLGEQAVRRLVA